MPGRSAAWSETAAVLVWWLRVPAPAETLGQQARVRDLTALDGTGRVVATEADGAVSAG
jgi:hypothetical protein